LRHTGSRAAGPIEQTLFACVVFGKKLDEDANLGREVPAGRIDGVDRAVGRAVKGRHFLDPTFGQIAPNHPRRQQRDTESLEPEMFERI
jgi:hypothetical protein